MTHWLGEYYDNETLSGSPVLVRNDVDIDFEWLGGSPDPVIYFDHFSARWTRTLYFSSGRYRFHVFHDDGARLWVDGDLVINEWHHGRETHTADVDLGTGQHSIKLEMYEIDGWASAMLWWESLPTPTLTSTPTPTATPVTTDWQGEYYNNETLSGSPGLVRNDVNIDFEWYSDSPDPVIYSDHFSARWMRTLYFSGGRYRFHVFHDDGARLWIDGNLLINEWHSGRETHTVDVDLGAAHHSIKLEMYEIDGWASAKLWWESLSTVTPTHTPTSTTTPTPTQTPTRIPVPDIEKPVVNWIAPIGNEQVYQVGDEVIQLEVSATDNVAVSRVRFYRWDHPNQRYVEIGNDYIAPYQMNLDCSTLNYAWNTILANAYDTAGNESERKWIWLDRVIRTSTPTSTSTPTKTLTSTPTATPTGTPEPTEVVVSNLRVASDKLYQVEKLAVGKGYYIDRGYLITSIPFGFEGLTWITTANADKQATTSSFLSFDISVDAWVYVAYDRRAESLPEWLRSFTPLGQGIGVTDGGASPLMLYGKRFSAGRVTLGGNWAQGGSGAGSNYVVLLKAVESIPTPTSTPTPTGTPEPTEVVVSNLWVASDKPYRVEKLTVGEGYYIDRGYQITSVPSGFEGLTWIMTANGDKQASASSFLSFDINVDAWVYVAYDHRAESLPEWLRSFTPLGQGIGATDGGASPLMLYGKRFSAGRVTLGGNWGHGASGAGSNYIVLLKAAG